MGIQISKMGSRVFLVVALVLVVSATAVFEEVHTGQFEVHQLQAESAKHAATPKVAPNAGESKPAISPPITAKTVRESAAAAEEAAADATQQAVSFAADKAAKAAANAARQEVADATSTSVNTAIVAARTVVRNAATKAEQAPTKARQAEISKAVSSAAGKAKADAEDAAESKIAAERVARTNMLKQKSTPGSGHQHGWTDHTMAGEEAQIIHSFSRGAKQPKALDRRPGDQSFAEALDSEVRTLEVAAHHRAGDKVTPGLITNAYKMGYHQAQQAKHATAFDNALKLHTIDEETVAHVKTDAPKVVIVKQKQEVVAPKVVIVKQPKEATQSPSKTKEFKHLISGKP